MALLVLLFFSIWTFEAYFLPKILLASILLFFGFIKEKEMKDRAFLLEILMFLVVVLISGLLSGDPWPNILGKYNSRFFGFLPLLVVLMGYLYPSKNMSRELRLAALAMSAFSILQAFNITMGSYMQDGRVTGTIGQPTFLGCALAMLIPWAEGWEAILPLIAIVLTGSRAPMLAGVIVLLLQRSKIDRKVLLVGATILISGILAVNHGVSDQIRIETWKSALRIWWKNPFFGCGSESFVDYFRSAHSDKWFTMVGRTTLQDYAHNDILHILASFGAFGFLLYAVISIAFFMFVWLRNTPYSQKVLLSMLAVFICAKFNAVPFPIQFSLALMLGSLQHNQTRLKLVIPAVISLCLIIIFSIITIADINYREAQRLFIAGDTAGIPYLQAAMQANPYEINYQVRSIETLIALYKQTDNVEYVGEAVLIGRRDVKMHPRSVLAWQSYAYVLFMAAEKDKSYLDEARKADSKMKELDPYL